MLASSVMSKCAVSIRTHREHEEHLRQLGAANPSRPRLHRRGRRREVQEHHPPVSVAVVPDAPGEAPRRAARGEYMGVEDPVGEAGGPLGAHEADGDDAVVGGRAGDRGGRQRGGRGGRRRSSAGEDADGGGGGRRRRRRRRLHRRRRGGGGGRAASTLSVLVSYFLWCVGLL